MVGFTETEMNLDERSLVVVVKKRRRNGLFIDVHMCTRDAYVLKSESLERVR